MRNALAKTILIVAGEAWHIPFFRRVLKQLKHRIYMDVDTVILIDYPGFNLRQNPPLCGSGPGYF